MPDAPSTDLESLNIEVRLASMQQVSQQLCNQLVLKGAEAKGVMLCLPAHLLG